MTLRSANTLDAYAIRATDGEIGGVHDFLFDDQHWTVRYMVADTGGWLSGRRVLISPVALGTADWQSQALDTRLTRRQVEHSPDTATDQPVSRQHEIELASYYGYAPYWTGAGIWGPGMDPLGLWGVGALDAGAATQRETAQEQRGDPHLHSIREVTGYAIQALDDDVGHVEDFILDDENWVIRYLVVDTRNWWPGKRVLISPRWITAVSWAERAVRVDMRKEQLKAGPEYDPARVLNREDEERLYRHYGQPAYWEGDARR